MDNTFERASRQKIRFPSCRGELTVEQLWDVPLLTTDAFCLDTIAQAIADDLETANKGRFVQANPDPRIAPLTLALDIVKRVIAVKVEEKERAKVAAEKRKRRAALIDALAEKENASLKKMSKKDILAELDELDGEEG